MRTEKKGKKKAKGRRLMTGLGKAASSPRYHAALRLQARFQHDASIPSTQAGQRQASEAGEATAAKAQVGDAYRKSSPCKAPTFRSPVAACRIHSTLPRTLPRSPPRPTRLDSAPAFSAPHLTIHRQPGPPLVPHISPSLHPSFSPSLGYTTATLQKPVDIYLTLTTPLHRFSQHTYRRSSRT